MTLTRAVEAGARAAREADVLAIAEYPGHGVKIGDYLTYNAGDAIELGIHLTEKDSDGKPRFHWCSDIRSDEQEEVEEAILRPCIEAAIRAALPIIGEELIAAVKAEIDSYDDRFHAPGAADAMAGAEAWQLGIDDACCFLWKDIEAALRLKIEEMGR